MSVRHSVALLVGISLAALWAAPGLGQAPSPSPSPDYLGMARQMFGDFDRERTLAQVREMYNEAKAAGEKVPADFWAWVREDVSRIGKWEYHVLRSKSQDAQKLAAQLNALGRERWECVAVSQATGELVLVFKRPLKSYLGQLDLRHVLRVLPAGR